MVSGIFSRSRCIVYYGTMFAIFYYRYRNGNYIFVFCYKYILFGIPGAKYRMSALCVVVHVNFLVGTRRQKMAMVPRTNTSTLPPEFNTWVRHYVHYDSLTKSFQNQTTNAREVKDLYEEKIVNALEHAGMKTATIQIANGRLQLVEEKHPAPLSFTTLTELLHDYYRAKGSAHQDETDNILRFVRSHRKIMVSSRLKRDLFVPPPAPGAGAINDK